LQHHRGVRRTPAPDDRPRPHRDRARPRLPAHRPGGRGHHLVRAIPFWRRAPPKHPSLVGRLVVLAAVWSLAVLAAAALVAAAFFNHAATARFDDGLSELVDNLIAGTSVDDAGEIAAPALTDQRALRALSGKYWEIAIPTGVGGLRAIERSRSLWESELAPPPGGSSVLSQKPGKPVFYDSVGPKHEPVRVAAMQARLSGVKSPLVF